MTMAPVDKLTEGELRVARQVGLGLSNTEIAEELCCSVSNVEWHLTSIYAKTGWNRLTLRVAMSAQVGEVMDMLAIMQARVSAMQKVLNEMQEEVTQWQTSLLGRG